MQRRTSAVIEPDLVVTQRDDRPRSAAMAEFVREVLKSMGANLPLLRRHLHWRGSYTGNATAEKFWQPIQTGTYAGYSAPRIIDQMPWHITWRYAPPGKTLDPLDVTAMPSLYARRSDGKHVPLPERRAISFTPLSVIEPYGRDAPLEVVFWALEMTRLATIDWGYLVEGYGSTPLIAKMGADEKDRDASQLAGEAAGLIERGYAVLRDDEDLERISGAVASGSADIGALTRHLGMIATGAILSGGFDSAGMGGSGGSNARAKSGDKVARPLLLLDMEFQAKLLERQLAWHIVNENFGEVIANAHAPYLSIDDHDTDVWALYQDGVKELREWDAELTPAQLYKLTCRIEPPAPDVETISPRSTESQPVETDEPDDEPQLPDDLTRFSEATQITPAAAAAASARIEQINKVREGPRRWRSTKTS
jgi:hypothetical protein